MSADWTSWATLSACGAFGLYAEGASKIGAALSSNVVTMVLALALANVGLLPAASPVYGTIVSRVVPIGVACLLFDADLDRVRREGRRLLLPYALASLGTVFGTFLAWYLVPLARGIPSAAHRAAMAAALCGRHIGGAVNYVSIAEFGRAPGDLVAAGIAADNCVVAPFFVALFALSGPAGEAEASTDARDEAAPAIGANEASQALALALGVVAIASRLQAAFAPDAAVLLPFATLVAVAFATLFPSVGARLAPAGRVIGVTAMQLFVAAIGAGGQVRRMARSGSWLAAFSAVSLAGHAAVLGLARRVLRVPVRELAVASNAAVGGPTTAASMAAAKGWDSLVLPALLVGILGYATGTFISIGIMRLLV